MKIAYVYDAVYPWETGGVQKRVWEVGHRLATRHDVHWYGLKYWSGPSVVERKGVTLHGVMEPTQLYVNGRRSISEAVTYSLRLIRPLLNEPFDVIDCQEFPYFPAFPSKLQSIARHSTLFLTWHEVWGEYWDEYLGVKGICGKTVERITALLPDQHIAVSKRTQKDLQQLGVSNAKLAPNGIEMKKIDSILAADRSIDFLYVGRLITEKNVDLLIHAIDRLQTKIRDLQCNIVGDGPERSQLEALVKKLGIEQNVTFTGKVEEYKDVIALMKAASVFILPSRREGFGICALEALACGTPVVTIDHPQNAAQELVENGVTGIICDPDASSLAQAIERTQTTTSSAACTASARQYDWDLITKILEEEYRDAVIAESEFSQRN